MVEHDSGRKAQAGRSCLLVGFCDGNGFAPQDRAATGLRVGLGGGAPTPLQPEDRLKPEDLEAASAQRHPSSSSCRLGHAPLTRRDFLMLNAGLLGAIAAGAAASSPTPDLPFFGQYYGNVLRGNVGDTNLDRGGTNGVFAFFYAERTGTVVALNWYYRFDYPAGSYSRGTGGIYTLEIRAADPVTKLPLSGATPICKLDGWTPPVTSGAGQDFVPNLAFTTTGQLIAKQPYALIARNTHASPNSNFVSQNTPVIYAFNDDSDPSNYAEPGDDVSGSIEPQNVSNSIAVVRGWHPVRIDGTLDLYPQPAIFRDNFRYRRIGQPFLTDLIYSDGQRGNWGSWGAEDDYAQPIQGTNQVRERFRVTRATRTVSGVFVRVSRHNSSGGSCVLTLESGPASDTSGNGSTIEQVSVPASNFLSVSNHFSVERWCESCGYTAPFFKVHWVWVPFSQNRTLTLGNIYSLRLSASGGFDGKIWTAARGEQQGIAHVATSWADHEANRTVGMNVWEDSRGVQTSTNSGSSWAVSRRMAPILFKCVTP